MRVRAVRLLVACIAASLALICVSNPSMGQGQRKEVAKKKAVKDASPQFLPIITPGANITYRIQLKKGYTFDPDNGDGIKANNVNGNLVAGAGRQITARIFELDFSTESNGLPGSANIRINITNPDGKLRFVKAGIVVANPGGNEAVSVSAGDKIVVQRTAVGSRPIGLAAANSGSDNFKTAFVANNASATVTAIDIPTNIVVATIPVGAQPNRIGVAGIPGVQTCWVTNTGSKSVTVFDAQNFNVLTTLPVGLNPVGITMVGQPGVSQQAWVANSGDNTVTVIDVLSTIVLTTIPVGRAPMGIAVTGLIGAQIVGVCESGDNTLGLIDANSGSILTHIRVGTTPVDVAVGGAERNLFWVANQGSDSASLVDPLTLEERIEIRVGSRPSGICVVGPATTEEVYTANAGDQTVTAISAGNLIVSATIPVGGQPRACFGIGAVNSPIVLVSV